MSIAKISSKKFSYTLKEQWDISGFQSNKYSPFISPFSLALLLIQLPSQLFQDQFNEMVSNAFLIFLVLIRIFSFILVTVFIRRAGGSYEVEFLTKEIKVKKIDGSILTIPFASLKQFRITPSIITLSTLKSGISLPTRVLSKEEIKTVADFCTDNLEKNYHLSIPRKIAVVIAIVLLHVISHIAGFFLRGYTTTYL